MKESLAFFRLCQVVGDGARHTHYDRTVDYAKKCKALVTGEDIDPLIEQFTRRESPEDFKQRKNLTFLTTTGILSRIKRNFSKALRNDEVKVTFMKGDGSPLPDDDVTEITAGFYQDSSIKQYMNLYALDMNWVDPNAWLLVDFEDFDANIEKPRPFPVIVPSHAALDYEEDYTGLHYLAREHVGGYSIHTSDFIVDFSLVDPEGKMPVDWSTQKKNWLNKVMAGEFELPIENEQYIKFGDKVYQFSLLTPNVNTIQARRFGYNHDAYTDNKTYVTPWHAGMNRIMGLVKSMSELNLSLTLHVFPQKVVRTRECTGGEVDGSFMPCNGGMVKHQDGSTTNCPTCEGKGGVTITSAQEIIEVVSRAGDTNQDIISIGEMVKYLELPMEVVEFLYKYINTEGFEVLKDVFPSVQFGERSAVKTATEVTVDYDAVNDVVFDFASHYSKLYEFTAKVCALIKDVEGVEVYHKFPSDLQLKSVQDLTSEYNATKDAPTIVRKTIITQLVKKLHGDNEQVMERERFKIEADVLTGMSVNQLGAGGEYIDPIDKYIHWNTEKIVRACEEQNPKFIQLEPKARMDTFRKVAESMIPSQSIPVVEE